MRENIFRYTFLLCVGLYSSSTCFAQTPAIKQATIQVQEAMMVTIEEKFGTEVKTIVDAVKKIERRYAPFDGIGRTFAILDAYGNKMPDGKFHISMHVSAEKAGGGKLILSTTGKVLWDCNIKESKEGKKIAGEKNLTIYIESGDAKKSDHLIDGSGNPSSIFQCKLNDTKQPLAAYWKDGEVKEFIFIYSACGCPVHIKFKRKGLTSVFMSGDLAVFPDDPAVQSVIKQLMVY